MSDPSFRDTIEAIRRMDDRFAPEAYALVLDAVQAAVALQGEPRHVHAREVVGALLRLVRDRFGVMGWTVLEAWGVRTTADVGDIVFHLVEAGVLSRREEDRREDFDDVVDLRHVLETTYFDDAPPSGPARSDAPPGGPGSARDETPPPDSAPGDAGPGGPPTPPDDPDEPGNS